jgi:hypothetical protein
VKEENKLNVVLYNVILYIPIVGGHPAKDFSLKQITYVSILARASRTNPLLL